MSRSGIVNVRMVITEEKILSNIDKIQKMINPNSKKQIVQLDDDSYFKDLIDSIKSYLIEYPKKKNFPVSVYKAAYGLVENATNQFEENTKKIEELIRQREENIALAGKLKELTAMVKAKQKGWRDSVKAAEEELPEELIEALGILGKAKSVKTESYQDALKLLNARVNNLESNLHIEIDMERIEDRSKALSYIGIEVADALKGIPAPAEEKEEALFIEEEPVVAKPTRTRAPKTTKTAKTPKAKVAAAAIAEIEEEPVIPVRAAKPVRPARNVAAATPRPKAKTKVVTPIIPAHAIEEDEIQEELAAYTAATTFERKPSLWQRIKESKLVKAVSYVLKIRIRIELPDALPEGRGDY